jgi:elongation factor G
VKHFRNIGIIAHIDAGKTTLTERILFYTGKEYTIGEVDQGTATMDWMEEEQKRGITITSAVTTCYWKPNLSSAIPTDSEYRLNIIDTPGHVDFTAEVERSLRVLDGAIGVFCAVGGVEAQSETVWHQANRYHIPRLVFVNKLDRIGSDFFAVLSQMSEKLDTCPLALQIPLGKEKEFYGVVDLIRMKAILFGEAMDDKTFRLINIPSDTLFIAQKYHEKLIETLSEKDDAILEPYLAGREIPLHNLVSSIRKLTLSCKITPVFSGSAINNIGIQPLLDAICAYLPSPLDLAPLCGLNSEINKPAFRKHSPDEYLSALVFKTMTERYGELSYLRIYSGQLEQGKTLYNPRTNKKERISKLFLMHANQRDAINSAQAGEIVAVIGLKNTATGDTLCDTRHPIVYERMVFPEPVVVIAIEPKTSVERDKLAFALSKLAHDDPTFQVKTDEETAQTIISGMGELHLEIIKNRILNEYKVMANVGAPQVAYRETILHSVEGQGTFNRKIADKEHFASISLRIEQDKSITKPSVHNLTDDATPKQFLPAIEDAIKSSLTSGRLAGYPLIYLKVSIISAGVHEQKSSEIAFSGAASIALQDALKKTPSILLEPIMKFEILTPEANMGDVINDLNKRRATIESVEMLGQSRRIHGKIPIAETFGYANVLRSITSGMGSYTLEPADYQPRLSGAASN